MDRKLFARIWRAVPAWGVAFMAAAALSANAGSWTNSYSSTAQFDGQAGNWKYLGSATFKGKNPTSVGDAIAYKPNGQLDIDTLVSSRSTRDAVQFSMSGCLMVTSAGAQFAGLYLPNRDYTGRPGSPSLGAGFELVFASFAQFNQSIGLIRGDGTWISIPEELLPTGGFQGTCATYRIVQDCSNVWAYINNRLVYQGPRLYPGSPTGALVQSTGAAIIINDIDLVAAGGRKCVAVCNDNDDSDDDDDDDCDDDDDHD